MRVLRNLNFFTCAATLTMISIVAPIFAQEIQRTKSQIAAAQEWDKDVTKATDRLSFLKQYKEKKVVLELISDDVLYGFKEYSYTKNAEKHIYGFVDEEMYYKMTYFALGPPKEYVADLVEKLGKPDNDILSDKDREREVTLHYWWFFKKDNLKIQCEILHAGRFGNVVMVQSTNTKVMDKLRKKVRK